MKNVLRRNKRDPSNALPDMPSTQLQITNRSFFLFQTTEKRDLCQKYLHQLCCVEFSSASKNKIGYLICPCATIYGYSGKQYLRSFQPLRNNINSVPHESCPIHLISGTIDRILKPVNHDQKQVRKEKPRDDQKCIHSQAVQLGLTFLLDFFWNGQYMP